MLRSEVNLFCLSEVAEEAAPVHEGAFTVLPRHSQSFELAEGVVVRIYSNPNKDRALVTVKNHNADIDAMIGTVNDSKWSEDISVENPTRLVGGDELTISVNNKRRGYSRHAVISVNPPDFKDHTFSISPAK